MINNQIGGSSGDKGYQFLATESGDIVALLPADEEVELTGVAEDVVKGKTVVTNAGIVEGTHTCPTVSDLLPDLSNPAAGAQILVDYEAVNDNGEKVTGTMVNNGAVNQSLNAGGFYTIPEGYHNGNGTISANSLASQTAATAAVTDIANGKTAWVNGEQVTGTANTDILKGIIYIGTHTLGSDSNESLYDCSDMVSNKNITIESGDIIIAAINPNKMDANYSGGLTKKFSLYIGTWMCYASNGTTGLSTPQVYLSGYPGYTSYYDVFYIKHYVLINS